MPETRWTPGPHGIEWPDEDSALALVEGPIIFGADNQPVAEILSADLDEGDRRFATHDAHLLRSAEDLYKALDMVRAMCEDPDNRFSLRTARLLDEIRNEVVMPALAKARGEGENDG